MIQYIVTGLIILLIIYFYLKTIKDTESFENSLPTLDSACFVHLFDNNGSKLNIVLVSKPFGSDKDYKLYLNNINKYKYLGITSYMEFPHKPTNPQDNYKIDTTSAETSSNAYNLEMYFKICEGWLHCFKDPIMYLPSDKAQILLSESDFIDYNRIKPDNKVVKEFDFLYSCPKVNKDSTCNDWVSFNKNWELAYKCLPILCKKFKLKGLLIGRDECTLPEGCEEYITTTGWLDYNTNIKQYNRCKFIFVPNVIDASPRVLTEALSSNLPCLVNNNILGGWKYVNKNTGELFNDENDITKSLTLLLDNMKNNTYQPREYIINNYGPVNSGKKLKQFLADNFKDKININMNDIEYVTIRHQYKDYKN
jgi:glycosyltransferase involved in cell wall biosynthesis